MMAAISNTANNDAKGAPGRLDLVRRFLNTVEFGSGDEEFSSPEALRDWLVKRELMSPGDPVTKANLRRAIDVREGLRAMLLANNGAELDTAAVERLDRAAGRAGLRVYAVPGEGPCLAPDAPGVDGALAELLAISARSAADGTWERFKACPRDVCRWAFYDHSKNRSKKWCDMDSCGNVEKARSFRERHAHT